MSGWLGNSPLFDYRLPKTDVRWWSVDISPDTFMVVGTGTKFRLSGSADPRYYLFMTGETLYVWAEAGLDLSGGIGQRNSVSGGPIVNADADWYPTRLPVSIGLHVYDRVSLGYSRGPGYWPFEDPPVWVPSVSQSSWSISAENELGPAFGRLRDAAPVLEALLIGEALDEEGLLAAPMSEDAVQALARTLAGSARIHYSHDANHGTKYYYAEVERVLAAAGCISGRLPARVWLRIREIVGRQPLLGDRYWLTGAKLSVRGGINASFSRYYYSHESLRGVVQGAFADASGLATFEFGYPLNARLHLSGDAAVHYRPAIGHRDASARAVFSYLLPDRMLASLHGQCNLVRTALSPVEDEGQSHQETSVGVDLLSYVEDHSSLTVGVSYHRFGWQPDGSPAWHQGWGLGCNVSLRRYF